MSVRELRREAVASRLSRKRDALGRRKEVLTELFYFTKHPDVPPDSESIIEQAVGESSDLKDFLAVNDLESGHIFQEGTLPQLQTAAVKAPEAPEVAEVPEVKVLEVKEVVAPKSSDIPPVTPQHAPSTSSVIVHPPSSGSTRMVTRVSSGAIRHKSVGELLGETPKSTPSRTTEAPRDPATIESLAAGFGQTITIPKTPNPPPPRTRGAIFQDPNLTTPPPSEDLDKLKAAAEIYALDHLVSKAHKSVTSADWTKGYNDKLTIAIVNRINELKEQGLWSLRQPEKQKAPSRANSHWDYLLKEMEWMSTNFYEDRKFMMKGAWVLAQAVKEYHDAEDNQSLLHKWPRRSRAPTKHLEEEAEADEDVLMVNHRGSASPISMDVDAQPQLEKPVVNGDAEQGEAMLIDEVKKESAEDEVLPTPSPSACEIEDPSAIFTLSQDSIYAPVNELPKQDGSSFPQLPIYGPPTLTDEPYSNEVDNYPIVPISKFCLQRHVVEVKNWEPRLKTYRELPREYPDEATEIGKEVQVEAIPSFAPAGDVHRRRMNTIFIRPPPPPNHWTDQKTSPWTPDEERQLLQLAKDSAYNFDLVASAMAFGASSVSDTEKRSAWECFEKFRAIYPDPNNIAVVGQNKNIALSRLEKAQRLSVSQASRNKPNMIVRQPRLDVRRHRYLNLFDAMRKSAKNREKQKAQDKPPVKKQKDNMPSKTNAPTPTPLDLAKLKAEKDRAFNQVLIAEQKSAAARATQIPQLPAGATPEMQEEYRRHLMAQQAAILTAQANANGQAIRANPGLGRGLVIPGGPNARPMPIRPNNPGLGQLSNAMANGVPIRLPDGTTAMPEQVQRIIRARQQMALASAAGGNLVPQTPQQMQRFRLLQQQVHLSQAQAGQNANANAATFAANGVAGQGQPQVGNLVPNNRMMQPPQGANALTQGLRQGVPQQIQLPQQPGLRVTPPRPSNLSPTAQHFPAVGNPQLQAVLQLVQQTNPQLSLPEATKIAVEHMNRLQAQAQAQASNGMLQHLQQQQQQVAHSSPTQQNQQLRQSPQNAQQRLS